MVLCYSGHMGKTLLNTTFFGLLGRFVLIIAAGMAIIVGVGTYNAQVNQAAPVESAVPQGSTRSN